jgi:hypothetical protein
MAFETKFDARFNEFDARFKGFEGKSDARFNEVNTKLDTLLNLHNIELRLAKLEAQKSA